MNFETHRSGYSDTYLKTRDGFVMLNSTGFIKLKMSDDKMNLFETDIIDEDMVFSEEDIFKLLNMIYSKENNYIFSCNFPDKILKATVIIALTTIGDFERDIKIELSDKRFAIDVDRILGKIIK